MPRTVGSTAAPYGYRVESRRELVQVPAEQSVLWLIAHLRRRGWALQRIADQLEEFGIRTRAGLPFSRQGLHLILRREGIAAGEELEDAG
jgi:hypothetical protein